MPADPTIAEAMGDLAMEALTSDLQQRLHVFARRATALLSLTNGTPESLRNVRAGVMSAPDMGAEMADAQLAEMAPEDRANLEVVVAQQLVGTMKEVAPAIAILCHALDYPVSDLEPEHLVLMAGVVDYVREMRSLREQGGRANV